jgi:hypothetical protein
MKKAKRRRRRNSRKKVKKEAEEEERYNSKVKNAPWVQVRLKEIWEMEAIQIQD